MPFFDRIFLKFISVGLLNTIISSSIMFLLYNFFNIGYWFSSGTVYFLGGVLNFFLNKNFTFSVKKWSFFIVIGFIVNMVISYFLAYGIAKPLVNFLLKDNNHKFRENVALLAGMCMFTGINYMGQRFFVFKRNNGIRQPTGLSNNSNDLEEQEEKIV